MADGRQRHIIFAGLGLLGFAAAVIWFGMLQPQEPGQSESAGSGAPVADSQAAPEQQPSTASPSATRQSVEPRQAETGAQSAEKTARAGDPRPSASPDASPTAPASAAEKPADAAADGAVTPSFDIVRVEPSGESVIAGRAAASATVELLRNGVMHARVVSDPSGLFAFVPPPLPAGSHEIVLQSIAPDGQRAQSRESVTIVVDPKRDAKPLIALASPDRPTVVLSQPENAAEPGSAPPTSTKPDTKTAAAPTGGAAAPQPSKPSTRPPSPSSGAQPPAAPATVTAARPETTAPDATATPPASPPAPPSRAAVKILSVEAEEGGRLFVSGQAAPGATVRLYLNETMIAPGGAGGDGRVSFAIGRGVRPGAYRVRLDDVDPVSGEVKTRAEVEFNVPAPLTVDVPTPPAPSVAPRVASAPPARPEAPATRPTAPAAGSARATPPQTTTPSRQPQPPGSPAGQPQVAAAPPPPESPVAQPAESRHEQGPVAAAPQAAPHREVAGRDAATASAPADGASAGTSAGKAAVSAAAPTTDAPATPSEPAKTVHAPSRATVASAAPAPARDPDPATVLIPEVNTAIVGRGDSLWRISRRIYGGGLRYTVIYTANKEQIRNPNLIYPGQVFVLPGGASEAASR
jgi:nucleoid-associated protein YgaU